MMMMSSKKSKKKIVTEKIKMPSGRTFSVTTINLDIIRKKKND